MNSNKGYQNPINSQKKFIGPKYFYLGFLDKMGKKAGPNKARRGLTWVSIDSGASQISQRFLLCLYSGRLKHIWKT